jgi:hypothetical protein
MAASNVKFAPYADSNDIPRMVADIANILLGTDQMSSYLKESSTPTITAGTTQTQAGATKLTKELNRVSTATSGDGVALPAGAPGMTIIVANDTANPIQVYGDATAADTINGVATATGVTQMTKSVVLYVCSVAGNWMCEGLGTGVSGSLQTVATQAGIVPGATQTQVGATVTNASLISAVPGTAGDGLRLPAAVFGAAVTAINTHATNAMQVYGAGTDTINGIATATGQPQAAGTTVGYNCVVAGNWITTPTFLPAKYVTAALQSATMTAAQVGGAAVVAFENTGVTPGNLQFPTAAALFAGVHNAQVGQGYLLKIRNSSSGANTATITTNTGITLAGTMTIAQNTTRDFLVTLTSATAVAVNSLGISAAAV